MTPIQLLYRAFKEPQKAHQFIRELEQRDPARASQLFDFVKKEGGPGREAFFEQGGLPLDPLVKEASLLRVIRDINPPQISATPLEMAVELQRRGPRFPAAVAQLTTDYAMILFGAEAWQEFWRKIVGEDPEVP